MRREREIARHRKREAQKETSTGCDDVLTTRVISSHKEPRCGTKCQIRARSATLWLAASDSIHTRTLRVVLRHNVSLLWLDAA
jgi:hypothetical protein